MPASAMVLYGSANRPTTDVDPSGGAIDTEWRPLWYELQWPSRIQLVSNGPDTRTVTITGRDGTGNPAEVTVTLNGETAVTTVVEFIHVDHVEASATSSNLTIRVIQWAGQRLLHEIEPDELGAFRMFRGSSASGSLVSRYEKLFWKNTDSSDVPTGAYVILTHDAVEKLEIGLDTALNSSSSVANRMIAPAGVSFVGDNVQAPVPGGTLPAGSAIGVWIKQTLSANDGPYDALGGLQFCGDFPGDDDGCPEIEPPECPFNCGPPVGPPPVEPPPVCTDATHIGQQNFGWALWNANTASGGNTRTSWGYISQDGEAYTLVGTGTCGPFVNMPYSNDPAQNCCQVNHITDDGATTTKIVSPNLPAAPLDSGSATCKIGQSDEPLFDIDNGTSDTGAFESAYIYPVRGIRIELDLVTGSSTFTGAWCKEGSDFYTAQNSAGGNFRICSYDAFAQTRPSPRLLDSGTILTSITNSGGISTLAGSSYLFFHTANASGVCKLHRIDRATLTNTTEICNLGNLEIMGMHQKADGTIWMFAEVSSRWAVWYWNGTELIYVGNTARPAQFTFGNVGMHFIDRRMFVGQRGQAGSTTGIYVTTLPCDEDTSTFAEVSANSASVVRGSVIGATWSDLLVPDANDRIHVRPAPTNPQDTGFVGSATTTVSTGGLSSGSVNITIPVGTTPGNYIMQLVSRNVVYVCRSANFAVTA